MEETKMQLDIKMSIVVSTYRSYQFEHVYKIEVVNSMAKKRIELMIVVSFAVEFIGDCFHYRIQKMNCGGNSNSRRSTIRLSLICYLFMFKLQ